MDDNEYKIRLDEIGRMPLRKRSVARLRLCDEMLEDD